MINSQELRRRNLVYTISNGGKISHIVEMPFQILEIHTFHVRAILEHKSPYLENEWHKFPYSDLSPIHLTEEWLLKLGWQKKTDCAPGIGEFHWFELGPYSTTHIADGLFGIQDINCKPLQYVHSLQNLYFALTGTELTIKP